MAVRNFIIYAGQSNMEGVAGSGNLIGLDSTLQGPQTPKIWNQRRGYENARTISAVTFDPNRWVTIDMATPHGCVFPPERKVPVTIANNTGAGAAAINGTYLARVVGALEGSPVLDRVTIDFTGNPRSGTPVVDGQIYVGGPGDWETLNASVAVHNNHSEWPLLGPLFGYFGVEMRLSWLLWGRYGVGQEPYVLKLSPPGSSLAPGHGAGGGTPKSSWHPDESFDQWYELWQRIYDAARNLFVDDGDSLRCRALFWIQGEADATDDYSARAYEGNWRRFVQAFRAQLAVAKATDLAAYNFDYVDPFPIVVGNIACNQVGETDTERVQLVRSALRNVGVGDSAYHLFDTFGKPRWDGVHFDSREIDEIAYGLDAALFSTGGLSAEAEETVDLSPAAQLERVRQAIYEVTTYGQSTSFQGRLLTRASLAELRRLELSLRHEVGRASRGSRSFIGFRGTS